MGVQEGLRRLALGQSNSSHPDWDALGHKYRRVERPDPRDPSEPPRVYYEGIDFDDESSFGRLYDSRGRPCDPDKEADELRNVAAMNQIITVAVRNAAEAAKRPDTSTKPPSDDAAVARAGHGRDQAIYTAHSLLRYACFFYSRSLLCRMIVWRSLANSTVSDILVQDLADPRAFVAILAAFGVQYLQIYVERGSRELSFIAVQRLRRTLNPPLVVLLAFATITTSRFPCFILQRFITLRILPWDMPLTLTGPRSPSVVPAAIASTLAGVVLKSLFQLPASLARGVLFTKCVLSRDRASQPLSIRDTHPLFAAFVGIPGTAGRWLRKILTGAASSDEHKRFLGRMDGRAFAFAAFNAHIKLLVDRAFSLPLYAIGLRLSAAGAALALRAVGAPAAAALVEADAYAPTEGLNPAVWLRAPQEAAWHVSRVGLALALNGASVVVLYALNPRVNVPAVPGLHL